MSRITGIGLGKPGIRVGDHIHMLDRLEGQGNARALGQWLRPGPGAEHDVGGVNGRAVGQPDTGCLVSVCQDFGDLDAFADRHATRLGRTGIGHAEIDGINVGVLRDMHRSGMFAEVQ